jgi:hypothetical protein
MSHRVTGISDKIPKHLQELFELLLGETFWLREQWQMYETLYDYSEERLNLLKRSAPSFFYMVNLLFADSFIISLCRLGDPATTKVKGKKVDNFSFEQLLSRLDQVKHADLIRKLKPLLTDFSEKCQKLRIHRNKRIGHSSLKEKMEEGKNPYPEISLNEIEEALVAAENCLHKIEGYFSGDESPIIANAIATDGATTLLDTLHRAVAYDGCVEMGLIERGTARKFVDPKA